MEHSFSRPRRRRSGILRINACGDCAPCGYTCVCKARRGSRKPYPQGANGVSRERVGEGSSHESGIDELLTEAGVGVLSMSADGVPYGVPLSFGYDGDDNLYFVFLGATTELRKETYAEQADIASFTTFDVGPDGSWRSVIVAGPLDRIEIKEWDTARESLADNAYQSNLLSEYE